MVNIYTLDKTKIFEEHNKLCSHPLLILNNIQSIEDVKTFMESHVYAVWDFMTLLKYLQAEITPSNFPWAPNRKFNPRAARLINDIVLCEETDITPIENEYMSHFDLYISAMKEVGANVNNVLRFVENVEQKGLEYALESTFVPAHAKEFMRKTLNFIQSNKPHVVASAFTFGRENVIPGMFKLVLQQLQINNTKAPYFHFYLERHIQVDTDEHGPAALELLDVLCGSDPLKIVEAEEAALAAIEARYKFWSSIEDSL